MSCEIKTYHFYNKCRYGDNLMNLRFFMVNRDLLIENNIHIMYYFEPGYCSWNEIQKYIDPTFMTLKTIYEMPSNAIELWMAHKIDGLMLFDFEKYYEKFYNMIYKHLGIDKKTDTMWLNESYLSLRYDNLNDKFKNADILVVNTKATGNLFDPYDELDKITLQLSTKYKVVTLRKISDTIPATLEDGLSFYDIGAIATHAKYVIAIITGGLHTMYNIETKNSVKKWFLIHTFCEDYKMYSIDNVFIKSNDLSPIKNFFSLE
jgi:hypothetical protein